MTIWDLVIQYNKVGFLIFVISYTIQVILIDYFHYKASLILLIVSSILYVLRFILLYWNDVKKYIKEKLK